MAVWGVSSTGKWQSDAIPRNFREGIAKWYPNGGAPLTAMLSKLKTKPTPNTKVEWWIEDFATQYGTVTGIYTDAAMKVPLTSTTKGVGSALWLKMALADVQHIRPGDLLRLTVSTYSRYSKVAIVTAVGENGNDSFAAVVTKEADAALDGASLNLTNRYFIIGDVNEENSSAPQNIVYEPTPLFNYTQIFRETLRLSGTALCTTTQYGTNEYLRQKKDAAERHSLKLEKSSLMGIKLSENGPGGHARRYMQGLIPFAVENTSASNRVSFKIANPGKTWASIGKDWLNDMLKVLYSKGSQERFCFCGNGVLAGVSKLAELYGTVNLQVGANSWGMKVSEWMTNFGSLTFKNHPLLNLDDDLQNVAIIFNPAGKNFGYAPLVGAGGSRDTKFYAAKDPGNQSENQIDGITEGWLTEATITWGLPVEYAILYDIGRDG